MVTLIFDPLLGADIYKVRFSGLALFFWAEPVPTRSGGANYKAGWFTISLNVWLDGRP